MIRLSLLFLPLFFFSEKHLLAQCPASNPVTVTNTNNVGGGSLNWAIGCINNTPALTTIEFNLPGATVISPTGAAPLPAITKANALIDGLSQPSGTVIIDGSSASSSANGLTVSAGGVTVRGLHIRDFGASAAGAGIALTSGGSQTVNSNRLTNNRIGVSITGNVPSFSISDNIIGLTAAGGASGNTAQGINIVVSTPLVGSITSNTIAHSGGAGINIPNGTVLIFDNSIYCNLGGGITRSGAPAAPVITSANTQRVRGTAATGRVIQVFSHSPTGCTAAPCQGKTLLGTVTTPATGIWQLDLSAGQIISGTQVIATSTQASNNTSVFSACITAADCSAFNANIGINSNVSCFGGNNGSATASATGGSPVAAPTFLWNTGAVSSTINNLTAGTYTVTATDAAGCTNSETATITQPSALSVSVSVTTVSCFGGNNGTATANPTGGTPGSTGYIYLWSNGQTAQTALNLAAATYTVTVSDAAGCTATASGTVSQPATALAATVGTTPVSCFGGNNGTATASPTGGTPNYTYLWSNGQTAQTATALTATTYTVTISDANGCSVVRTATVGQPSTILATTVSTTPATCFGQNNGTATANPTGGTPGGPGYTYLWDNGQTTKTALNLAAATYTVTVSDVAGCTATASGTVSQPTALAASVSTSPVGCFGENTGGATAAASGGTPGSTGYQYIWNTGSGGANLANIPAGIYTVTITDAIGCTSTGSGTISQPTALTASVSTSPASCFGGNNGTATANPSGGTPNYTYLWSNGQTAPAATALTAATYTVTVSDAAGCTATASGTISQPTALSLSLSSTDETAVGANNGTATATTSGGTPTLLYQWSNGQTTAVITGLAPGVYTVIVTDANGCTISDFVSVSSFQCAGLNLSVNSTNVTCFGAANGTATAVPSGSSGYTFLWNTGAVAASIANLPSGNYTVTVTDAAGCTIIGGANISQPPAISLVVNHTDVICNGAANGTASAAATGGTPSFSYTWSNGVSGQNLTGLAPATYTVTATDAAGCTASQTASITQPPALTLSVTKTDETAFNKKDGTATAVTGGGTPPLSLLWSNGATTASILNLAPGIYTVTLTDANGCTRSASATVAAFGCSGLSVGISKTDATCNGAANGTATANPAGGTTPFTYLWNNGQTGKTATALAPATYTVTVTDAAGCTASQTVSIAQPPALTLSVTKTDETAVNKKDGTATAVTGGGTPPLSLLWSNGATTASIQNLAPGTYTVTLTDANGCTRSASATVAVGSGGSGGSSCKSQPVYAVLAPSQVCGNQPFTLEADDLFPHPAVRYVWQFPNGDSAVSAKTAISVTPTSTAFSGEYFVLRDSAGCRSKSVGGAPISVISLAPGTLKAGNDTLICTAGVVVLKAAAPPAGISANWFSLGSAQVDNPNLVLTSARNLAPGANRFLWKIDLPGCPAAAADTVTYFLEVPPRANDDRYILQRASDVAVMEVLLNDNLIGLADTIVYQLNSPSVGDLEYLPAGRRFRYTVDDGYRGTVTFRYAVCPESASACGFDCDTATVTIEVLNLPKVPEGLIINDPGANGRLLIKGISPDMRLDISIFNRWGDLVFSSKNYGTEKPWEGDFNGKKLPQGAYYYQMQTYESGKPLGGPQKGVVHLFDR